MWRWDRAIYDPAEGGHLRIELRALPSGPTVTDMLANAALLLGLTLALAVVERRLDRSRALAMLERYLELQRERARDPVHTWPLL